MRYIPAIVLLACLLYSCDKAEKKPAGKPVDTTEINKPATGNSKLNYLRQYVGKVGVANKFYESEPLKGMLKEILGEDWKSFRGAMQFADSLKTENAIFYSISKLPKNSKKQGFAFVLIDPSKDQVHFSVVIETLRYEYQKKDTRIALPEEVKNLLQDRGLAF